MKILLSLACIAVLSYGADVFYAKINDNGTLSYITSKNDVETYKFCSTNEQTYHDDNKCKESERVASSLEFQNFVAISKFQSNSSDINEKKYRYQCGVFGSFKGNEQRLCEQKHPFFSVQMGASFGQTVLRNTGAVVVGAFTFGLGLLAIGTDAVYEFDVQKYNKFIDIYGLERKKDFFNVFENTNTTKFIGCDLSRYEAQDYTSITPETACGHQPDEGLFIYTTTKDNRVEAVGLFDEDELKKPLKVTQKITQRMIENYMDVVALHPEIPLPQTLPQLVLEKSQFEKEVDFQKRKNKALSQREEEQKELNEAYISAVKKRNLAIFEELEDRKSTVKKKIVEFRKQAFMAVATPPNFAFKNYDAENEKLYGEFSFGDNAYRVVSINVDPKTAQRVHDNSVALTPQANYEMIQSGDSATFQTKELLLLVGSDKLKFDYTDNRYQPTSMTLVIPSYDLSAFQDGIADATKEAATISSTALKALQDLERYRVKSQLAISDTAIHRVNAKAPNWYENPNCGQDKCAVGRGETQSEALKVALAQLGCILKSSIVSELVVEKTVTDDISEQKRTNYTIQQSCSNTFDEGKLKLTNTGEMDGWYYVRTTLDSNKL